MKNQKIYQRQYSKGNTKHGENIKMILEELKDGALLTIELLDLIFGAYQRSYKSALGIIEYKRPKKQTQREIERKEQQVFYSLLNRLKREGFVIKKQSKLGSFWNVTKRGLKKLKLLQNQDKKRLKYPIKQEATLKIITFDIPETEKKKREWLRGALRFLGFKMLQRSVWIGKNKVPEDFLFDLRDGGLLGCVHVLEVGAGGTVKDL